MTRSLCLALALTLVSSTVAAQQLVQELVPDPTKHHKFFVDKLAIDGNTAVAGDFNYMMEENCGFQEHGALQVFKKVGTEWQRAEFFRYPDDTTDVQRHGWSVALNGNVIVAATPGKRWVSGGTTLLAAGALSVYHRSSATAPFAFAGHLYAPNPAEGDQLGWPVDIASNGVYAAAVSEDHRDQIHVFQVHPTLTYLTTISYPNGAWPWKMHITSQNVLVTDSGGFPAPFAWKLNGTQATPIDTSSLGQPYDVTDADLVGDGNSVAWIVADGTWPQYLLRIAKFGADAVQSVKTYPLAPGEGASLPMTLEEDQGFFMSAGGSFVSSYKYVDGDYRYQGHVYQSPLEVRSLAFNGTDLFVGDHLPHHPGPSTCNDAIGSIWVYQPLAPTAAGPGVSTGLQPWSHTPKYNNGAAVALGGAFAVAAAPDSYRAGGPGGAALLYQKLNGAWRQVEEYVDNWSGQRGDAWSGFGASVDINANFVAVGAPWAMNWWGIETGTVHVAHRLGDTYRRGPYLDEVHTLSLEEWNEGFGAGVALSGNLLFVGAPAWAAAPGSPNAGGSVYVFEWMGTYWYPRQTLKNPNVQAYEGFGYRVAASGDHLIVGIPYRSTNGFTSNGSVEIFRRDGATGDYVSAGEFWAPFALGDWANFGNAVTIGADYAAAGSPSGTVVVYRRSGTSWAQHSGNPLTPGQFGFGSSLAIEGTSLVVGSPWENRVHRYQRVVTFGVGRWLRTGTLVGATSSFGSSVDLDAGVAMLGESYGTTAGLPIGSTYVTNFLDIQ
jgi:hypothetical protein